MADTLTCPGLADALRAAGAGAWADRFTSKVREDSSGCWLWTGSLTNGYGRFSVDRRDWLAHRLLWVTLRGSLTAQVDHRCHNGTTCLGGRSCLHRRCVRLSHLEEIPQRVNVLRSHVSAPAINSRKTHCDSGHEFTPANTYWRRGRGDEMWRDCRDCIGERGRRRRR